MLAEFAGEPVWEKHVPFLCNVLYTVSSLLVGKGYISIDRRERVGDELLGGFLRHPSARPLLTQGVCGQGQDAERFLISWRTVR